MPGRDGRGPAGSGGGRGGRKRIFVTGPGGYCICTGCGTKYPHLQGQPCSQRICPKCGQRMTRGQS